MTNSQLPNTNSGITTTRTSTITDHPESTFSSPVPVSVTDPNNGKVSLTTPVAVTVLSTSTEPNGEYVTYTHVIANPTGWPEGQSSKRTGFMEKNGTVAGVFTVVGIISCAISICLVVLFRRHRRRTRRRKWLMTIQSPRPSDPFEDPPNTPQMGSVTRSREETAWDGNTPFIYSSNTRRISSRSGQPQPDAPLIDVESDLTPQKVPVHVGHLFDHHKYNPALGFGVGYGHSNGQPRDGASMARSTPSIYPESLAESGDDSTSDNNHSTKSSDYYAHPIRRNLTEGAPPRPPRSHLRGSISKHIEMHPITPPTSISSHVHSVPQSPSLEQENFFTRRTLLDVRRRSAQPKEIVAQTF